MSTSCKALEYVQCRGFFVIDALSQGALVWAKQALGQLGMLLSSSVGKPPPLGVAVLQRKGTKSSTQLQVYFSAIMTSVIRVLAFPKWSVTVAHAASYFCIADSAAPRQQVSPQGVLVLHFAHHGSTPRRCCRWQDCGHCCQSSCRAPADHRRRRKLLQSSFHSLQQLYGTHNTAACPAGGTSILLCNNYQSSNYVLHGSNV